MEGESLQLLREIKSSLSIVLGTNKLPSERQLSVESLDNAVKEFQKLSIEREEWIESDKIDKYIKGAPWNCGSFIIKQFGFTNYFKKGRTIYYNREDIIALGKELKERNVDLARYMELCADKENFQKKLEVHQLKERKKSEKKGYKMPKNAKDITTSNPPKPSIELVRADLKRLKKEFFEFKLNEYIEIYHGNYAMPKNFYRYKMYLESGLSRRIYKWRDEFNNANEVLKEITKKKEIFIPVPENEIINL